MPVLDKKVTSSSKFFIIQAKGRLLSRNEQMNEYYVDENVRDEII